jgi:hypothetical protein
MATRQRQSIHFTSHDNVADHESDLADYPQRSFGTRGLASASGRALTSGLEEPRAASNVVQR